MFKARRRQKRLRARRDALARDTAIQRTGQLHWRALHDDTAGVGNALAEEVVVSLTTFDKRIDNVYLTIESLLQQSLKPDRVVLWIAEGELGGAGLPYILRLQERRGLEVRFCAEDLGPYKKFYYALQCFPDSLLITVDDDTLYPHDLVDQLYRAHRADPDSVPCHRAHRIRLAGDGAVLPYKRWEKPTLDGTPSPLVFPTGVGGVLYAPGHLDDQVLDRDRFMALCPGADDIWLKAMSLKAGRRCRRVPDPRDFRGRFLTVEESQVHSLKRANKAADGNDRKLRAVFDHYHLWGRLQGDV